MYQSQWIANNSTVVIVGLARAIEITLYNIVSRKQLEDDGIALRSTDGLRNEVESCGSDLHGMYRSRSQWYKSGSDEAMHRG
jgi:hypothetical protein